MGSGKDDPDMQKIAQESKDEVIDMFKEAIDIVNIDFKHLKASFLKFKITKISVINSHIMYFSQAFLCTK
jgi:hypothetical protein